METDDLSDLGWDLEDFGYKREDWVKRDQPRSDGYSPNFTAGTSGG